MVSADNRYPGGKGVSGLHQWIIAKMRTHSFYAEPFAGKAAVLRNKPPALATLLLDQDPEVVDWLMRLQLPGCTIRCGDAIAWLQNEAQELDSDALIYLDPPYLLSTRVKKRIYKFELTKRQHIQTLKAARIVNCGVMISGYPSALYEEHLFDWHRFETQAMTRGGVMRTEVLWTNYDPSTASPLLAMEYSGLGENFRERERVARKIKRWQLKLQSLPAAERRALLLSLLDADLIESRSTIVEAGDGRPASEMAMLQ